MDEEEPAPSAATPPPSEKDRWGQGKPSIAVLPLETIAAGAEDYFTDGMTAELIEAMMRIHGWRIISRTSAMHVTHIQNYTNVS